MSLVEFIANLQIDPWVDLRAHQPLTQINLTRVGMLPGCANGGTVTAPGVVDGLPEGAYHAHPALSQSGAKLLLRPHCPALFKYQRDNGQPHKAVFDFGSAAHKTVLGVGQPVRYIYADTWQTKAAKEERADAYALGEIPLLEKDRGIIEGMAAALRAHELASALLDPASGKAEQSLFYQDPHTEVGLRGRLDWMPTVGYRPRLHLADYKTTVNANPDDFGRTAATFGYHMQAGWYLDLVISLGIDPDPAFLFVLQEKTPPYLISIVELTAESVAIGRQLNRQAIDLYAECLATGEWPGYPSGVSLASLPAWYRRTLETDAA